MRVQSSELTDKMKICLSLAFARRLNLDHSVELQRSDISDLIINTFYLLVRRWDAFACSLWFSGFRFHSVNVFITVLSDQLSFIFQVFKMNKN